MKLLLEITLSIVATLLIFSIPLMMLWEHLSNNYCMKPEWKLRFYRLFHWRTPYDDV